MVFKKIAAKIHRKRSPDSAFTMLEVLLVVAMIAILAGIVIFTVNPGKQLAEARNAQRRVDVNTILTAIYQYTIDNHGNLPGTIPGTATEICLDANGDCSGYVNLGVLTAQEKYLVSMPRDPSGLCAANSTCYHVLIDSYNRVTVQAQWAELGQTISVTR